MVLVCFQGKLFNITVIQAYASTTNAEEAEVDQFCEDLEDLLEPTPLKKKKKVLYSSLGVGMQNRNLRDTWSNKQVWPWRTK